MKLFFLTSQPELCRNYCEMLHRQGHSSTIYTEISSFYFDVKNYGPSQIDLLVIDFNIFDHDCNNPFVLMKKKNCAIPIVYYNDSFPSEEGCVDYWCRKNQYLLRGYIEEDAMDRLRPLLYLLRSAVDFEKQKELLSRETKNDVIPQPGFNAEVFSAKYKLSPSRYKLLKLFTKNQGLSLTEEDLCYKLWGEVSQKNINNLYTYIHDLRKTFSSAQYMENYSLLLTKTQEHGYCFTVNQQIDV